MKFKIFLTSLVWAASVLLVGCSPSFETLFEKGKKNYEEKNYVQAVDQLNLAIPKWKESEGTRHQGEAYQLLGKSYHELGNIDKAAEAYKQAIAISTDTFDSAYDLGLIYLTAKQSQLALTTFRQALTMKPDNPLALIGLGNTYFDLGDYPNAMQMYQRVILVSPGVTDALRYMALTKQRMAHHSAARHVSTKKLVLPVNNQKIKITHSLKKAKKIKRR